VSRKVSYVREIARKRFREETGLQQSLAGDS